MKKSYIGVIVIIIITATVIFTVTTLYTVIPSDPLEGSDQLVLVLARTRNTHNAVLQVFNREGDRWKFRFSCPVVIGENGMAWGRGLHKESDNINDDPVKREGDGCSPEGAFELLHAYGYQPPSAVNIRFPYTQSTSEMICVDDTGSDYYNKIIDIRGKRLERDTLPSHEKMILGDNDERYKYAIFVGHNTWKPKKGAGSCIFLHMWEDPNSYTAGCTAMAEENILRLLSWLTTEKNPVLIQLTRKNYFQLREDWGLPDVTI